MPRTLDLSHQSEPTLVDLRRCIKVVLRRSRQSLSRAKGEAPAREYEVRCLVEIARRLGVDDP